jgi:hypothetical protein
MLLALLVLGLLASPLANESAPQVRKGLRTKAQQKISGQLLDEIERVKSGASPTQKPSARPLVRIDEKQRALIDLRTVVTREMTDRVVAIGGTLVSTAPEAHSIIAWVPLLELEALAETPTIRAIEPAASATTNPTQKEKS